ncbi:MAG: hypothetical protein ABI592_10420 [Acidobacteriota bacterium]
MPSRPDSRSRRGRGETAFALLFFSAAAVLFSWPLAARLTTGLPDVWDVKLNAWILHWDFHQVFRDPLRLFDANIFFPARYALAFSENLFGAAVFGFPLYAAGVSTLTAANVVMLLGMALSGVAAWALAREITGDAAASLLAGVVYAFVGWRLAQLPHVQFQWGAFLALLLLFLLRYLERGRPRDAALFGLFLAWNALTNVHYAMFSGLLVALVTAHAALSLSRPVFRARLPGIALAAAIAVVAVLPFYVPYARASKLYGMKRSEGEIAFYSARPVDFFTSGPQNKLYAPLQKFGHAEGDLFPGLVPLALGAFAVFRLRSKNSPPDGRTASPGRRRATRVLDGLLVVGVVAWAVLVFRHRESIGPLRVRDPGRILFWLGCLALARAATAFPRWSRFSDLGDFVRRTRLGSRVVLLLAMGVLGALVAMGMRTPFYRFLVQSGGPAFRSIRVPARGIVLSHLALGPLAAWGLSLLASRKRKAVLVAAALALTAIEYRAFPIDVPAVDPEPAPVYRWLATVPLPGAAVEWPIRDEVEAEHVFRSTAHWKPIVNGFSGFGPPSYRRLTDVLSPPEIDDHVWTVLQELGATVLLFHPTEATEKEDRRKYLAAVRSGLTAGRLIPVAWFSRPGTDIPDYAFRLATAPAFPIPVPAGRELDAASALASLSDLEARISRFYPPFGFLDRPREGESVSSGAWSFGWALDDSGIASVSVSADGGPRTASVIGQDYPGIDAIYPKYPDAPHPGFGFAVPALSSGPHALSVEIMGKDGGSVKLERRIVVR